MKNRTSLILLIMALLAFTATEVAFLAWRVSDRENSRAIEIAAEPAEDKGLADAEEPEDPVKEAKEIARENPDAEYEGFIVTLSEDAGSDTVARIDEAIAAGEGIRKLEYTENTYVCEDPERFRELTGPGEIESAEPDFKLYMLEDVSEMTTEPDDTGYTKQYNIDMMNVQAVWNGGLEGQDIDSTADADGNGVYDDDDMVVAVIDSGLNAGHEDFDPSRIVEGRSYYGDDDDTSDADGHGTLIAGIIAATKNNGVGGAGLLQSVKIMPIRVFDPKGETSYAIVADALHYLIERKEDGVNVVAANLSLGGPGGGTKLQEACNDAMDAGIIVVCAAGNDYNTQGEYSVYPAQFTMGVGALTKKGKVARYSQRMTEASGDGWERKVWVSAPGDSLYGPSHVASDQYITNNGTSFACPEVTALAALCKSIDNDMTQADFMELMKDTAVGDFHNGEGEKVQDAGFGWGTVDFAETVDELLERTGAMAENDSAVTVSVLNRAGSVITGADVTVKEKASGTAAEAGEDGIWHLKKGTEYKYTVSSQGYDADTAVFTPLTDSMTLTVTLEGSKRYKVSFSITDEDGNAIPEGDDTYTYSVCSLPGETTVSTIRGIFTGRYRLKIKSSLYHVQGSYDFTVDDVAEDLSNGKTVSIVLMDDMTGLSWTNGAGVTSESLAALSKIKKTGRVMSHSASGDDGSIDVEGITVNDLFEKIMSLNEDIVSVEVEGKRLVKVEPEAGEEDNQEAEDSYMLEDASVTIEGSDVSKVILAVTDPSGNDELVKETDPESNSMRVVVSGRDENDWLYSPSRISIRTVRNLKYCAIGGIGDRSYTGAAITLPVSVTLGTETLEEGVDYSLAYEENVNAGTARVILTGLGECRGSVTKTFRINKAPASLNVITSTASVKKSKLKKKAQTVKLSKVVSVSGGYGPVTYVKAGGSKKLSINKTSGKITVKKKTKKGKYKLRIRVNAAGDRNHEAAEKTVTVTIRVK